MARKYILLGILIIIVALWAGSGLRTLTAPTTPSAIPSPLTDARPRETEPRVVGDATGTLSTIQEDKSTPVEKIQPLPPRPGLARLVKIKELESAVKKYASLHHVDEDLVWAVMRHESGFNPQAVSPKGAMGLMQLMPGTASSMGVTDPFDIEQNIAGGIKYLEVCLKQFNQNLTLALAAYNAGPQNVAKYQGCPPFAETHRYVSAVLTTYSGNPHYRSLHLASSVNQEVNALLDKVGLAWRVPLPQWKIGAAQYQVRPPRWKGTQAELASLAR